MEAEAKAVPRWQILLSIALGYLVACYSVGLIFAVQIPFEKHSDIGFVEAVVFMPFTALIFVIPLCLPGFLILRCLLFLARLRDPFTFGFAGAFLGYGTISLLAFESWELYLKYPPDPILAIAGAVAGAVACLTERWYLGRVMRARPITPQTPTMEA